MALVLRVVFKSKPYLKLVAPQVRLHETETTSTRPEAGPQVKTWESPCSGLDELRWTQEEEEDEDGTKKEEDETKEKWDEGARMPLPEVPSLPSTHLGFKWDFHVSTSTHDRTVSYMVCHAHVLSTRRRGGADRLTGGSSSYQSPCPEDVFKAHSRACVRWPCREVHHRDAACRFVRWIFFLQLRRHFLSDWQLVPRDEAGDETMKDAKEWRQLAD